MSTLAPFPESDATQFVARPDSRCKSQGRAKLIARQVI